MRAPALGAGSVGNIAGQLGLVVGSDDFSIRITREGDPLFFIRIETPAADPIVVSDFKTPGIGSIEAAAALRYALREAGADLARLGAVLFADIAPGASETDARWAEETVRHRAVGASLARALRRSVLQSDSATRRGKLDYQVLLGSEARASRERGAVA